MDVYFLKARHCNKHRDVVSYRFHFFLNVIYFASVYIFILFYYDLFCCCYHS